MQDSAVTHYRAFLGTAEAAAAAHEAASGALAQLDVLAADLPQLAAAASTFSRSAAQLVDQRARTKQLQGAIMGRRLGAAICIIPWSGGTISFNGATCGWMSMQHSPAVDSICWSPLPAPPGVRQATVPSSRNGHSQGTLTVLQNSAPY